MIQIIIFYTYHLIVNVQELSVMVLKVFKVALNILIFLILLFFIFSDLKVIAQAAKQKDATVVAVQELTDLEGDEWSYRAVQELVEKYDVLEGYPDGTFKGKTPSTRFELAAAVYDLATYFSEEIALDREDLAKLAKLLDEFSNELKTIQGRVDELQNRVSVVETKTTTLEGQVQQQGAQLEEHEKRLAYSERRKGFIIERLVKGVFVDIRDISRGVFAAVIAPFNKKVSEALVK